MSDETADIQTFVKGPVFRGLRVPAGFEKDPAFLSSLEKLIGKQRFTVLVPEGTPRSEGDRDALLRINLPRAAQFAWPGDWVMVSEGTAKMQEISLMAQYQVKAFGLRKL